MNFKEVKVLKAPVWVIYGVLAVILLIIAAVVYRKYFMTDKTELQNEINSRASISAANSGADVTQTGKIIANEVNEITNSYSQSKAVKDYATASGMSLAAALADTAYNNAKAKGFLI